MVASSHPRVEVLAPPTRDAAVAAVALVLHGGRETSSEPVRPSQLAVLRMRPFARSLAAAGGARGLAVWSLQYRVRGWNGDARSPVADTQWALAELGARYGDVPVVLVGYSMGGRTAVAVAGHPRVVALAALAPWLPLGEPYEQVAGRAVLVAHGLSDTRTSPLGSLEWSRGAATVTDRIWRVEIRWERHAMLRRARLWHSLTTRFSLAALGMGPMPSILTPPDGTERLRITL
jgi:predicted alpha/beta-hydrolase family hydrolase